MLHVHILCYARAMSSSHLPTPDDLVREARRRVCETQEMFAKRVGSTQPLVSKYESGGVAPPASVLMHCIHILDGGISETVSEGQLAKLVKERLRGRDNAAIRGAVAKLILTLAPIA